MRQQLWAAMWALLSLLRPFTSVWAMFVLPGCEVAAIQLFISLSENVVLASTGIMFLTSFEKVDAIV